MLTKDYIVGLVDGEGSFTVYVKNKQTSQERKRRTRIEPKFYLKLTAEDKDILFAIKKFFQCGQVYYQKDSRPKHKDCYRYEVVCRKDLKEIIIPFFKENRLKLPTKRRDFKIFCQIMNAIGRGEHLTENGLTKLHQLKQKMH